MTYTADSTFAALILTIVAVLASFSITCPVRHVVPLPVRVESTRRTGR